MTRTTMLAVAIGAMLVGSADAATPGPVCQEECAPRIQRDCGSLHGKARRRCRRQLVRACKATTPELACALTDAGADGGTESGPANSEPGSPAAGGSGSGAVQAITAALGNKLVTLDSNRFFSSGSIAETQKLQLCSSGSVSLVDTTITSTTDPDFDNTFDDTKTFDGTWRVRLVTGAPVLELDLGEPQPRQLAITQDAQGALFLDGTRADIEDAAGTCGGAPAQPSDPRTSDPTGGTPDPVAQVTQTLAGHALILTETNAGFGTRRTAIVLCTSGRYVKDVTVSAAPGRVQETIGAWTVTVDGIGPVLTLTADQTVTNGQLAVSADAQGNLLLNGIAVTEGDPTAVPGICAQI
jgi:hypothetical protein